MSSSNDPKVAVREMHHVAINVSDIEASLHFYVDVLGLELAVRATLHGRSITRLVGLPPGAQAKQAFVRGPRSVGQVELIEWSVPRRTVQRSIPDLGLSLISFGVPSDHFELLWQRCRDEGVEVVAGPEILNIAEFAATKLLVVLDPDGVPVELMSPATDEDVARWG